MTGFPSLKNDLNPKLKLKRTQAEEISDEEVDANSQAVGKRWGATTSLNESVKPSALRTPVVSVRGYLPAYLDAELALKAAERRVTKTFLIVEALAKFGYRVDQADLVEDRRKRL